MVRGDADADARAFFVIQMARKQRQHLNPIRSSQRVKDVGTFERLAHHNGAKAMTVIGDDIVRANQHVALQFRFLSQEFWP